MEFEPYNPEVHGEIQGVNNNIPEGFEPYNPEVHGEIVQPKSFIQDVGESSTFGEVLSKTQERIFKDYIPRAYEAAKGVLPENHRKVVEGIESVVPDFVAESAGEAIQAIPRGAYNTVAETARSVAMLNPMSDSHDPLAWLGKSMGEFNDQTPTGVGEFVETGVRIAPAIMGAAGIAKSLPVAATKTGSVIKGLVGLMGADVFSSLFTLDPDTQTLLVGDKAAFPIIPGWGVKKDGTVDPNVFTQKLNLLTDALVISGITGATTATAGKLIKKAWQAAPEKTIKGIGDFFSKERTEEETLRPIIELLGDIKPDDPIEVVQQKRAKVIEILRNNKEKIIDWTAVDPSLGPVKTKKDTVSLITDELSKSGDLYSDQITDLNDLRRGVGGSNTESTLQKPVRQFEQSMDDATKAFGGIDNIETQGNQIVKRLDQQIVRPFEEELGGAMAKKADIAQSLLNEMNTNPQIISVLNRLDKNVKVNLKDKSVEAATRLVDNLEELGREMTTTKNNLYAEVGIAAQNSGVRGSGKIIDTATANLSENAKKYLASKGVFEEISNSNLDILELEKISGFSISDLTESLRGEGRYGLAQELIKFKKALTVDQLDYLARAKQKGNAAVVKAAKKAYEYYTKEYLPWRENPILEDILNLSREGNKATSITKFDRALIRPATELGETLNTNAFLEFTQKNLGQDFNEAVADFTMLRWAEDLQGLANSGKIINPEDISSIQDALTKWGPVLQKASPKKYQAITDIFTRFRDGAFDIDSLDQTIIRLSKDVENQKSFMYDTLLKNFNTVNGSVPNSYSSFTKLLTTEGNEEAVKRMLDVIKQNPELERGMKAVYTSVLKDYIFDTGGRRGSSQARKFNLNNITTFLDKNSSVNRYSRQILGDGATSVFEETLKVIYDTGSIVGGRGKSPVAVNSITRAGGAAINRVMTLLFGVLNPTAARVRTMTSQFVEGASTTPFVADFLDKALANSDIVLEVAERMQKKGVQQISPEDMKMLLKAFNRTTIYTATGKNENTVDQQTNEVFNTNQTEQLDEKE